MVKSLLESHKNLEEEFGQTTFCSRSGLHLLPLLGHGELTGRMRFV